jgi:hypothetical protein
MLTTFYTEHCTMCIAAAIVCGFLFVLSCIAIHMMLMGLWMTQQKYQQNSGCEFYCFLGKYISSLFFISECFVLRCHLSLFAFVRSAAQTLRDKTRRSFAVIITHVKPKDRYDSSYFWFRHRAPTGICCRFFV